MYNDVNIIHGGADNFFISDVTIYNFNFSCHIRVIEWSHVKDDDVLTFFYEITGEIYS